MKEPWIQTYTGKQFSYLEASADQISIDDIARSLSHLCRFTGHCKSFYSVAQHSVMVSQKTTNQFFGLMHDADEAYTGDMNRPLKHFLGKGSFFERAANTAWYAIRDKFPRLKEVTPEEEADCKTIDLRMLVTESHELLLNGPHPDWQINQLTHPRYEGEITPWMPDYAMRRFLDRFNELSAT